MLKKLKKWWRKRRLALILIAIIIVIVLILTGTKIFLYINYVLGNDILINLNADKGLLQLERNHKDKVTFEASVTANPFCNSLCYSAFEDLSSNKTIETSSFRLKPGFPLQKAYWINATRLGNGMDVYRFSMECRSEKTFLCHTTEKPTTQSSLVLVLYNLTQEDETLKNELKDKLDFLASDTRMLLNKLAAFNITYYAINEAVDMQFPNLENKKILRLINELYALSDLWYKQNYYAIAKKMGFAENSLLQARNEITKAYENLSLAVERHNQLIDDLYFAEKQLDSLTSSPYLDEATIDTLNKTVVGFNSAVQEFAQRVTIDKKESNVKNVFLSIASVQDTLKYQMLKRELELDVSYDTLCQVANLCITHPTITERSTQLTFNATKICGDVSSLRSIELNKSKEGYPIDDGFWSNISAKASNIRQNITNAYLNALSDKSINTPIIKKILSTKPLVKTEDYEYDLTPALVAELAEQFPEECPKLNITAVKANSVSFDNIIFPETDAVLDIVFEEPEPRCCIFGKCEPCCMTDECMADLSTAPIMFLHGHAVDKSLTADYSLEGFNQIQENLEDEGYLNAGTVTLYPPELPYGVLGRVNAPSTFRASYYFDVFKNPESYVIVPTKSESIETYAIRVNELVNNVLYKTGKPKVNIIAFSMGGLVARRYLQIFGDDKVHKLILIGTPNHGTKGNVAGLCPLVGEELECRDMKADSLFINKLNRGHLPNIPFYNIVGTGCVMEGEMGDGAVLEKSAWLDGAQNFVINGTCKSTTEPLHLDLRDTELYPKVYDIIKRVLKE